MSRLLVIFFLFLFFKSEAQPVSDLTVGDSLYALGDYSKAILFYKKTVRNEQLNVKIAKSYEALGNAPEAIKYYKQVISNHPHAFVARYNYGKLLTTTNNYHEADSIFKQLSKENPKNPNFIYQRGILREKQNDSLSFQYFSQVFQLDNNHLNAIYKIAKRYVVKRRFKEAISFINKGLNANENSIRFLTLQALRYYHTKNFHEAVNTYKKLLQLKESNPQLHENLAISYSKTNRFEKAIKQFTVLINQFDDKNPSYHYNIGKSFMALHYFENAKKHINLAIVLQDISLDREYSALSGIYRQEGNYEKELKLLEKALMENPNNELVNYQLAVAADNYFEDKKTVLHYYKKYLEKYGKTGKMRKLAKQRMTDLKKELHFAKD